MRAIEEIISVDQQIQSYVSDSKYWIEIDK